MVTVMFYFVVSMSTHDKNNNFLSYDLKINFNNLFAYIMVKETFNKI